MPFNLRDLADRISPRPKRQSPEPFDGSVFDAGSPQYVRPEDLFLDVQSQLFGIPRQQARDLSGIDPSDFKRRWLIAATEDLTIARIGDVSNEALVEAAESLMRTPRRKQEKHPTLLPIVPALGHYKNISPRLPNYLNDQFLPALRFADEDRFQVRLEGFAQCLAIDSPNDSIKALASALLPIATFSLKNRAFNGPVLRDLGVHPNGSLPVCASFAEAIDTLVDLGPKLPRIVWARWLTAVLRVWLPMFFLRRCLVTQAGAEAARDVIGGGALPDQDSLTKRLLGNRHVLRGSRDYLGQLAPIIRQYVRARFQISTLLDLSNLHEWLSTQHGLSALRAGDHAEIATRLENLESLSLPEYCGFFKKKVLAMPGDKNHLAFDEWLGWLQSNRLALDSLSAIIGAENATDLIDTVYSYIRPIYEPLASKFGRNAYEFVAYTLGAPRKVDRDPEFPDEFNLIYRGEGGQRARRIVVQPGPQLLALLVQLVSYRAKRELDSAAKLSELLDLFETLGVDFRSEPSDFETLENELLRLGLLQSSADAAEAASLKAPYSF